MNPFSALPPASSSSINVPVKPKVLLAEDDEAQRIYISCMLARGGYEVTQVEDGQQAWEMMQAEPFSMLVTDWEMPNMDGIGLCRTIRSSDSPNYTYIIMLTARDAIDHVVTGLQSGADDYLAKPVVEAELLARLNTGKRLLNMERSLRIVNIENQRLCTVDALTGAFNRRYLMDYLAHELVRSVRYQHPLSLLLCDVDHFKLINDHYGHQVGDTALVQLVDVLQSCIRQSDWIARYGGEEFIIVLPETTIGDAAMIAERCRSALENKHVRVGDEVIPITASFGVSGWEHAVPKGADINQLIAMADERMYTSKKDGRNRVTAEHDSGKPQD